eukprot:764811-Hanusia_phi.AAC.7
MVTTWTEVTWFCVSETDESTVEHPLYHKYRLLYEEKRQEKLISSGKFDHSQHESFHNDDSLKPISISHEEVPSTAERWRMADCIADNQVLDMAQYYDVHPQHECDLLQIIREAVLAPLPWMFREVEDALLLDEIVGMVEVVIMMRCQREEEEDHGGGDDDGEGDDGDNTTWGRRKG